MSPESAVAIGVAYVVTVYVIVEGATEDTVGVACTPGLDISEYDA